MALTTVRPQGMGFVTGRRNLIINGAMQVNQRNADTTGTSHYNTDRYKQEYTGGTSTFSWETLSSGSPYDEGFRRFSRLTNTATASGAANYRQLRYAMEAQDVANSGWDYTNSNSFVTVSFWVRSSVAGKYTFTFQTEDGTDKLYNFSRTLVADTWTKVTQTVPGHADLQFDNDSGNGLMLHFRTWLGSDYTSATSEDAWVTYSASTISESGIANWAGTTNSTYDITGVQLELGTNASDFEHRSFGEELQLCKRYYEQHNFDTTTSMYGGAQSGSRGECPFVYDVPKRANPTISVNDRQAFRVNDWRGGDQQCSAFTALETRPRQARLGFDKSTSNLDTGRVVYINREGSFGTDPILYIDAEL